MIEDDIGRTPTGCPLTIAVSAYQVTNLSKNESDIGEN
jgi:hypothetical protein